MSKPIVDRIAQDFVDQLSFDTKLKMYTDMKDTNQNSVDAAMDSAVSIEAAVDEFAFQVMWRMQHRLLNAVLTDQEIEERVDAA
jgi:hypothetical protein